MLLFITLSLLPWCYNKPVVEQLTLTKRNLIEYLPHALKWKMLYFELTKKGNIHYHGVLEYRGKMSEEDCIFRIQDLFKKDLFYVNCKAKVPYRRQILGNTDVSIVKDIENVENYIKKNVKETHRKTGLNPNCLKDSFQKKFQIVSMEFDMTYNDNVDADF